MTRITTEKRALEIVADGHNLPSLPAVGQRLLFLSRQPIDKIDISSFSKLIESDPVLTAKILRLANSSFFGTIKEITGIRHAIMHIGLEETINSVCLFIYKEALPKFPQLESFSGSGYWDFSWACASSNRMLGHPSHAPLSKALPGELYIMGLLHGIGKLILASNHPDDFQQCLKNSENLRQPLAQAEKDIFGTTDTEIAYVFLKSWHFPTHICSAIRHFLSPHTAAREHRELAALTQLAYYIANNSDIGNSGDNFNSNIKQTYIFQNWVLPLSDKNKQAAIIKDIYATLKKKSSILGNNNANKESEKTIKPEIKKGPEASSGNPRRKQGIMGKFISLFN